MLTTQEREYILNSMKTLLDEYDYDYTTFALDKIIDEWASQKAELIEAFKRHPNYVDGKFMIAFTQNYERTLDMDEIDNFQGYIYGLIPLYANTLPPDIDKQRIEDGTPLLPINLYNMFASSRFNRFFGARVISEETAKKLEIILPQIHPHAGQKTSRVVNKIMQYLHYDQDPDYNRKFAKFADALSPIIIKRHTVLSINPLDYLTMSFGNSWSSCHTIDKENKRGMPNSYEGMYSSGTMSYMLDASSMVFYTVDSSYDGDEYWTQPKICRQMFHYGEEKLVQSRLYPQDNDDNNEAYTPYRNVVQSIISLIFNFPNLWKVSKGYKAAKEYIDSDGTHYRDYENFDSCSLSRITNSTNENCFVVGAEPICINCGDRHLVENNINHCASGRRCESCGRIIRYEDDECWVGDYCYCPDCVAWCECCEEYEISDNMIYVESENRYICRSCIDEYYVMCEGCDEYVREDEAYYIDSEAIYVCEDCFNENYFYCDECGEYFNRREANVVNGHMYCPDCYEDKFGDEEEDEE